jgi:hypothetical protein
MVNTLLTQAVKVFMADTMYSAEKARMQSIKVKVNLEIYM